MRAFRAFWNRVGAASDRSAANGRTVAADTSTQSRKSLNTASCLMLSKFLASSPRKRRSFQRRTRSGRHRPGQIVEPSTDLVERRRRHGGVGGDHRVEQVQEL